MKRIVICADGTWNERDQVNDETGKPRPTNVTKVARAIRARARDGVDQVVYYHDGVGTSGGVDKYTGGAFGNGIEANVRDLYRFILYNYEERDAGSRPDELFFFGFSRGAFTVRTLAGFMKKVGLLQKDDDYFVPEIYALYEKNEARDSDAWKQAFRHISGTRVCPTIKFVGVWDTVGALGAPGVLGQFFHRGKYKYHDVGLGAHIQNAFHALAIDERRKPFLPNIWTRTPDFTGTLEQAWFAGVHSNVGGGYHPDGLANEALHWMVSKARALSLDFDDDYLRPFKPCFNSKLHDSMTKLYRVMGPVTRSIGDHVADGECIHRSAIDRLGHGDSRYAPENLEKDRGGRTPRPVVDTAGIEGGKPC